MAYDIIGNVTDSRDGFPVVGAVVVDIQPNGSYTASTSTDGNGYYAIKTQQPSLKFVATGYYDKTIDLTKLGGDVLNLDVQLEQDKLNDPSKVLNIVSPKSKKEYVIGAISALVFMTSTYMYGKKIGMENKILMASTIGMGALGYVVGYSATKLSYKKNKEETLDK
jgi:hypothetical protein